MKVTEFLSWTPFRKIATWPAVPASVIGPAVQVPFVSTIVESGGIFSVVVPGEGAGTGTGAGTGAGVAVGAGIEAASTPGWQRNLPDPGGPQDIIPVFTSKLHTCVGMS